MFTTPLPQVTYDQVLSFGQTFPEGVRVEYKRQIANIPKVVSSFANTVGGIWVIGVETDKATNRAILPPVGIEHTPGIEEQIVQSAQQGIYPAITPAVRILQIPDKPGRVVVVVKVPESIEAPHAIENSTRVWVRTASTTEPYELADIDRIEYLLKRRREPEQRREELIQRTTRRSFFRDMQPRVRVVICPVYPRGVLLPHDELYERAEHFEKLNAYYLHDFRLVHEAIVSVQSGSHGYYFELSINGVAFLEAPPITTSHVGQIPFVLLQHLLYPVGHALNTVIGFLKDTTTNLMIRYELFGFDGHAFLPAEPSKLVRPAEAVAETLRCKDHHVAVQATALAETLVAERVQILTLLMKQVLWAFNYRDPELAMRVYQAAKGLNLA